MTANHSDQKTPSTVQVSRVLRLPWSIALGASVTVGLGVISLLGEIIQLAGDRTPFVYGLAAVIFLPLVLTLAQRAVLVTHGRGAFNLAHDDEPPPAVFTSSWLSLGGFACLAALLGWGAALHLNLGLERLFAVSLDAQKLAPVIIFVVALNRLFGGQGTWRTRAALAIGVAIAVTFLVPTHRLTGEIVARTQPNLLDMLVALASGAAAAYALSRKQVAAALPGVAIAAALLPPLCVVGYGIGSAPLSTPSLGWMPTNLPTSVVVSAVLLESRYPYAPE